MQALGGIIRKTLAVAKRRLEMKLRDVILLTLDEEEIVAWAKEQGLPAELGSLSQHPRVHKLVQTELDRANAKYARVEQVKKFAILDHDLSQEGGELTPTLKVKRSVVNQKYADLLDSLYSDRR